MEILHLRSHRLNKIKTVNYMSTVHHATLSNCFNALFPITWFKCILRINKPAYIILIIKINSCSINVVRLFTYMYIQTYAQKTDKV